MKCDPMGFKPICQNKEFTPREKKMYFVQKKGEKVPNFSETEKMNGIAVI